MVKESGVSLPGGDKLNMAVARIMAQSPEISQDRAEELVESILARLKGAGATGDKVL
jgi:ABC-type phosphate transport system ATPase subunit